MTTEELRSEIDAICEDATPQRERAYEVVDELLRALEVGEIRSAEPTVGGWKLHEWVKRGILLAFRIGVDRTTELPPAFYFRDRDTLPTRSIPGGVRAPRVVPGGTSIRRGAFLAEGVVVMPPAYVNVGAWVGEGTMIDSHVLVGSCAQVGRGVHLSAGVQIGGVLEPIGALPVIVEDEAFIGGGCGLYEGVRVGRRAVLAPGVVVTRSVPVHDLVHEIVRTSREGEPEIPEGAVVVPGSRPASGDYARSRGVQLQTPVIVKYRDPGTDSAVALEEALR